MRYERDRCLDLGVSLARRWLETDGRGGYATSTILGCAVSRRDGLLVAPFEGTRIPHLFLARFDEEIVEGDRGFPISVARYPGSLQPAGHRFLDSFESAPWPRTTFRIGDVTVVREVLAVRGESTVLVRWSVEGPGAARTLRLRPFLPCREAGALCVENVYLDGRAEVLARGIRVRPYPSLPAVSLTAGPGPVAFVREPHWYNRVEFEEDSARGEKGHEDQWTPGVLVLPVEDGGEAVVAATLGAPVEDPAALWRREARRRRGKGRLEAADAFLVRTEGLRPAVVAGYPRAELRGREAFLALPGLTLARGQVEACGDVLAAAVPVLEASAAGWWIRAVDLYAKAGGKSRRLRGELLPAVLAAVDLLRGEAGPGEDPAERAALRLLALDVATRAAGRLGRRRDRAALAEEARREGEAFLLAEFAHGPGLVIAASFAAVPFPKARRAAIVETARRELLTPRGLRTRSPDHPSGAGPALPHLLGFYVEASLRVRGRGRAVKREMLELLEGTDAALEERCLGHVAERFDGNPPHPPEGDFAAAAATGEILRARRLLRSGRG